MGQIAVYVEEGSRRTFVCAVDWPGWARSARTTGDALEAFLSYGSRYVDTVAPKGLKLPRTTDGFEVIERLPGDATTDFGAPARECSRDAQALEGKELTRQLKILDAAWDALDATARAKEGVELRKGPRGGGRDLDKIVNHVFEAEVSYLANLGGRFKAHPDEPPSVQNNRLRTEMVELIRARAEGFEPVMGPRRRKPFWSLRYGTRRTAWHVLDHVWEIEDRA